MQLVPLASSHAEATLRWVSDPEIAAAIGLTAAPSRERTLEFIAGAEADDSVDAAAILVEDTHVGNVVLDLIDRRVGTARLSIYIGPSEARGRGCGRAAIRGTLERAFGELGLHKVWLVVHERNAAAIAAYEACGFRVEGRLRDEFLLGDVRVDALRMGVLADEAAPA